MARAYAEHDPALLALGRRLVGDGTLDQLLGASIQQVLERLRPELCQVAAPVEGTWPGPGSRRDDPRL